jgi:pimeloyl-ACP methyl ester carboxylesterase
MNAISNRKKSIGRPLFLLAAALLGACNNNNSKESAHHMVATTTKSQFFTNGYSQVNGLKMYYEIHGTGDPIVLIHGGGSTIETNFGKLIPVLSRHRKVIAMELQAHGRTADRETELTFEQDADDVAALLRNLNTGKADILGFSNGGTTALQIAIRHPDMVNKLTLCSALTKRNGVPEWFWGFMSQASLENMPEALKEGYIKAGGNPEGLQRMHDKDARRMIHFKDIPDELIRGVAQPTLIIIGDKDVITPEHALELHRQIPHSELAIIPGGHGEYIGEITTVTPQFQDDHLVVPMIEKFLAKKTAPDRPELKGSN